MRTIKINGKPYNIKFSYRAAKYDKCVEQAFMIASGAHILSSLADSEHPRYSDFIKGSCKEMGMTAEMCDTFFYAGLIDDKDNEYRPKTEEEAGELLIDYMEETGKNYADIYDSLVECMQEDGFFEKAGITKRVEKLNEGVKNAIEEAQQESPAPTEEKVTPIKKTSAKKTTTTKKTTKASTK